MKYLNSNVEISSEFDNHAKALRFLLNSGLPTNEYCFPPPENEFAEEIANKAARYAACAIMPFLHDYHEAKRNIAERHFPKDAPVKKGQFLVAMIGSAFQIGIV